MPVQEIHGRLTGKRQYGDLGILHPNCALTDEESSVDIVAALMTAIQWKPVRSAFLRLLNTRESEMIRFVEKARELQLLSKTHQQERALRLAGAMYRQFFKNRVFDGIAQHDRTCKTAQLWGQVKKSSEPACSYAVMEEVLALSYQRSRMLSLGIVPKILSAYDVKRVSDDMQVELQNLQNAEQKQEPDRLRQMQETIDALEILAAVEVPHDHRTWLTLWRTVTKPLKIPVVLSDMTIPGAPMVCVNDAFCRCTGYSREEVQGRNCRFLQGPATTNESISVIQRALADQADCQVAMYNYRKDGQIFLNLLSMRPINDVNDEYTYVVAVQFEVEETEVIAMAKNLRLLEDLLDMMPLKVPFRKLTFQDRIPPPLKFHSVTYDRTHALSVVRRYEFALTRLKWLMSPVLTVRRLLRLAVIKDRLFDLVRAPDLGSAVCLHAFQVLTTSQTSSSLEVDTAVEILAKHFLPKLMASPEGYAFVKDLRDHETSSECLTKGPHLVCTADLSKFDDTVVCNKDLADGFLECFRTAAKEAPVACIACDCETPGVPVIFVNARFVRLGGFASDDEILGKSCRTLQHERTQKEQRYLVEELSKAVRTQSPALVKAYNQAKGKAVPLQNFICLHPVHMMPKGEYFFQIGLQVNIDDKPDVVDQKLVDAELFLSLLPHTIDMSLDHDMASLPAIQWRPPSTGGEDERGSEPFMTSSLEQPGSPPPVMAQQVPAGGTPPQTEEEELLLPQTTNLGPKADRRARLATERTCLDAILKFTAVRWLQDPLATTEMLLRQGPCRDAFEAFARRRSRIAAALVRGFDLCDEILCAATVQEQKQLAVKYHSGWKANPLFLFCQTEIPVGALSQLDFDWSPILADLPKLLERCIKVLSVNVLPAFILSDDAKTMLATLLAHPVTMTLPSTHNHHHAPKSEVDTPVETGDGDRSVVDEIEEQDGVPELDPMLYTAAHHPRAGVPILSLDGGCAATPAAFWYEMACNLIGDDDSSSYREKERLQGLNGAIIGFDDVQRLTPAESAWLGSLINAYGEDIVRDVLDAIQQDSGGGGPRVVAIGPQQTSLLFVQPIDATYRIVFSVELTRDEKYVNSLTGLGDFLDRCPLTLDGLRTNSLVSDEVVANDEAIGLYVVADAPIEEDDRLTDDELLDQPPPPQQVVVSPRRPQTAPSFRSPPTSPERKADLKSPAARSLMSTITKQLDNYVQERRAKHEDDFSAEIKFKFRYSAT